MSLSGNLLILARQRLFRNRFVFGEVQEAKWSGILAQPLFSKIQQFGTQFAHIIAGEKQDLGHIGI